MLDIARFAVAGGIVRWIPQGIHSHQPPAVSAMTVMVFFATFAERCGTVTQRIVPPDTLAAAVTEQRFRFQAVGAEVFTFKQNHSGNWKNLSTDFTGKQISLQLSVLLLEQIVNGSAQRRRSCRQENSQQLFCYLAYLVIHVATPY